MKNKVEILSLTIAGVVGSLTNTLLVMHLFFFLFRDSYAEVRNIAIEAGYGVSLRIISINGILEAIVGGILNASTGVSLKVIY